MEATPSEKLIHHAYTLFASGDIDLLRVAFAERAVWHEPGRSPLAGDYKGPEEILGFLRKLQELSDGTFAIEIEAVLGDPERTVVLQRETAERNGKRLDVIAAVDFEVHAGRITEATVYHGDTYQFDEFWS